MKSHLIISAITVVTTLSLLTSPFRVAAEEQPVGPTLSSNETTPDPAPEETPIPFDLPQISPGASITLGEAVRMADERNLSIEAIRATIASADADLYKAWAALFPVASASMTYSHLDHEDTSTMAGMEFVTRYQNNLSGGIDVRMPVINPTIWKGIDLGKVGKEVTELTATNVRQSLLLTVSRSYYQALAAKALIEVSETQIRSAARHLAVAKMRHVSGVGSRLDVVRANGDLVRVKDLLLSAHVSFDNARDVLGVLTGVGGSPMPVDGQDSGLGDESEESLISKARDNREDLKLKKKLVELADTQLEMSWMQFLPSLDASWQLTHQFTEPGETASDERTRWSAYLFLTVPIYSQTRYADLDKGRAEVRRATLEAEDAEQQAVLEIRSLRRSYLSAMQKVEIASEQSQLARETLTLVETEYISGTGSSLAVTDARRSNNEAEINMATKRLEAQIALLELMRAVGSDMSSLEN